MNKVLGLDIGSNSIGWAIMNDGKLQRAGVYIRPKKISIANKIKKAWPLVMHTTLAMLFTTSLCMIFVDKRDFQFWLNIAITVMFGWVSYKQGRRS